VDTCHIDTTSTGGFLMWGLLGFSGGKKNHNFQLAFQQNSQLAA